MLFRWRARAGFGQGPISRLFCPYMIKRAAGFRSRLAGAPVRWPA